MKRIRFKPKEEWRRLHFIDGHYEISSMGRVRNFLHRMPYGFIRRRVPLYLNGYLRKDGYLVVFLPTNKKQKVWRVHHLMLRAFVGTPQTRMDAAHLNGTPSDNRLENLVWATRKENMAHAKAHGTYSHGEKHGATTLTDKQAKEIKNSHEKLRILSKKYGVSETTCSRIRLGKSWVHV